MIRYSLCWTSAASSDKLSATDDKKWHRDFIDVTFLEPDGDGGLKKNPKQIKNIHSKNTSGLVRKIIGYEIKGKSAVEIWDDRERLFPNLCFAPSVENNLKSLGSTEFHAAVSKLHSLDKSAEKWNSRPSYILNMRPESEATMNQYRKDRVFRGENGIDHTYELHATVTGGFRIHFREIVDRKKFEIGYIGKHRKVSKRN